MARVFHPGKLVEYLLTKKFVIIFILVVIIVPINFLVLKYSRVDSAEYKLKPPVSDSKNWKLIFDDEFNGSSLDKTKWVPCFRWTDGTGCATTTTPQTWYSPSNVIISNGTLKLRTQNHPVTMDGKAYPYTSSMITTGPVDNTKTPAKFLFTYGYMEIRAKVPKGQGLWSAFWALPLDDSGLPELDISEVLTGAGLTTYINNMTYGVTNDNAGSSGASWTSPVDLASGFHTYAVDWEPNAIRWYVDGIERRTAFTDKKNITAKQMYLLLQLEVGGTWPGSPDKSTPFPSAYEIDYIKVWQHPHTTSTH